MARAYSSDLRIRVVSYLNSGRSCRKAARLFEVSVASVVRWSQLHRRTGDVAAKRVGGSRPLLLLSQREWLLARVAAKPDLTLAAIRAELAERGVTVGHATAWRFLAAAGLSFKKSLHASEQERADVARKRERWKRYQGRVDSKRLVFVDETWAKTNMTRTHGRAARGERLIGRVPHGHWTTMTFLAALRSDRIDAPCVFDGPINAESFLAWVTQALVPTLGKGDVVVLDNLGSHKSPAVRAAIRAAGAHLFFLPPYSPDLNPIEMVFAKLKTLLRKADERSIVNVWKRIGSLLDRFPPDECARYLRHAGYVAT